LSFRAQGHNLALGLFHTDASTRSEHLRQMTGAYVYHCAFTLARAGALTEITLVNVRLFVYTRAFNEMLAHSHE